MTAGAEDTTDLRYGALHRQIAMRRLHIDNHIECLIRKRHRLRLALMKGKACTRESPTAMGDRPWRQVESSHRARRAIAADIPTTAAAPAAHFENIANTEIHPAKNVMIELYCGAIRLICGKQRQELDRRIGVPIAKIHECP